MDTINLENLYMDKKNDDLNVHELFLKVNTLYLLKKKIETKQFSITIRTPLRCQIIHREFLKRVNEEYHNVYYLIYPKQVIF